MGTSTPYVCPQCVLEDSYNGRLRHGDQPVPQCLNHGKPDDIRPVEMIPVKRKQ